MNEPDPSVELLLRHLANLHELVREQGIRLRRIEAAVLHLRETGLLAPLGSLRAAPKRQDGGDDAWWEREGL